MSAVVVNRIRLKVPAEDVLADIDREIPSFIRTLPGFERFTVAKIGDQEVIAVIFWATPEDAAHGGAIIGPGLFNTWIAPRAESQDRVVGTVVVDTGA